ncbi:protein NKG7 [Suncus etruscus]|uniref:protein NKG7 n=1 Tax=Suncus etruscus TaxID=109475 RepID=UPI00210FCEDB|nr:protein NKG7 [Suncus etruscus]
MEPCRVLALCTSVLALTCLLVALSTDYWYLVIGAHFTAHSGIWSKDPSESVRGSVRVTQGFGVVAALWGVVAVVFLGMSYIPALSAPGRGPIVSCFTAFAAALSTVVALAVYTSMRWSQPTHAQIQSLFSWSFYVGWTSTVLFLITGSLSLGAHFRAHQTSYDNM